MSLKSIFFHNPQPYGDNIILKSNIWIQTVILFYYGFSV